MFPKRKVIHKQMDEFLTMMDEVIKNKRELLEKDIKNEDLEDNERDLLSLMIESEEDGETLNDVELKVLKKIEYLAFTVCINLFVDRATYVYFSWLVMILQLTLYHLQSIIWLKTRLVVIR
jgi:hypothetical protein